MRCGALPVTIKPNPAITRCWGRCQPSTPLEPLGGIVTWSCRCAYGFTALDHPNCTGR